jgi:hypothetical protein
VATSGSVDFTVTRNQIIEGAMRLLGVLGQGRSISAKETSDGAEALNMMVKSWQARNVGLWKNQTCTLFLKKSVSEYSLGTASGAAHCTASHVETTLSADEATSSMVIDVTSSTGMTAADDIGIILDDGTIDWTTIDSVDSSTKITITTGLTSAATTGNRVYTYTTKINRPLNIVEMRHRAAGSDGTDIPIDLISRQEYMFLSNKTNTGVTTQAFYDPQTSLSKLFLWPVPANSDETIRMTVKAPIEDFDADSDEADYPQEWFVALKFSLAAQIGHEYNVKLDKLNHIIQLAQYELELVSGFDEEPVSLYITPTDNWG